MTQVELLQTMLENTEWTETERKIILNGIKDAKLIEEQKKNKIKNFFKPLLTKLSQ